MTPGQVSFQLTSLHTDLPTAGQPCVTPSSGYPPRGNEINGQSSKPLPNAPLTGYRLIPHPLHLHDAGPLRIGMLKVR